MNSKVEMLIKVTEEEANVILKLVEILDECSIPLSDEEYVDILRTIAYKQRDTEIDDDFYKICIEYEEKED